jgi:hypothetical protein
MKKHLFAMSIMAVLAMVPVAAQDVNEILDSYFETVGQKKLLKVKTIETSGKIMQMGMEMPFRTVSKKPNKGYMEAEFQGSLMKMGYNGETGWMVAPWTGSAEPIDLSGPDVRQVRDIGDIEGPLWNWEEKGHTLEYSGSEDMEGSEVHVLKLTREDGDIIDFYIDADNYVVLKTKSTIFVNDSEMEIETYLSNYQEIEGIVQPFTIESRMGGQTTSTISMEEVSFNGDFEDALFEKPVSE